MLQVRYISVMKADNSVQNFYLLQVKRTLHSLNKKVSDDYGYVYQPTQEIITGNYLEIASGNIVSTKCFVEFVPIFEKQIFVLNEK